MIELQETTYRIEPCMPERPTARLVKLADEAGRRADRLVSGMHPYTAHAISRYVRLVEAAGSCRIEGIDADPLDIAALMEGGEVPEHRRLAALAGRAVEAVQVRIDGIQYEGPPGSARQIAWIHRSLFAEMPAESGILGGRLRGEGEQVSIGRHVPPADPAPFLDHFEERYAPSLRQGVDGAIAWAASHHRLLYIHPFVDGNGRTARLAAHAVADRVGLRGGHLWSLSRAILAAGADRYRSMLDHADTPRQGALDGRGNLSDRALSAFCEWMLEAVIDHMTAMAAYLPKEAIEARFRSVAERLAPHAGDLVCRILAYGHGNPRDFAQLEGIETSKGLAAADALVEAGLAAWVAGVPGTGPLRLSIPMSQHRTLLPGLLA